MNYKIFSTLISFGFHRVDENKFILDKDENKYEFTVACPDIFQIKLSREIDNVVYPQSHQFTLTEVIMHDSNLFNYIDSIMDNLNYKMNIYVNNSRGI